MEDFVPYKQWLHQHDEEIRRDFPDRPTGPMAEEMDVNYYTLSRRATRMGVRKSAAFMHTSWKKGSGKKGGWKKAWVRSELGVARDGYLTKHFADTRNEDLARLFGADVKTVRRWARRLGLVKSEAFMREASGRGRRNRMKGGRYYTDEQEAWRRRRIAEVYPDGDEAALRRLAEELGVTRSSVSAMAGKLGIRRSEAAVRASMERMSDRMRERATRYGPDVIERLKAYYPTHTNEECAERFGMSKGSVFQLARRHGIRKTAEHKSKVYSRSHRKKRG